MTSRVLINALDYAGRGWPVFPCQPGEKVPATSHGYLDATTDPDQITWWFRTHPERNLAVATGYPGPDILDIDQHGQAGDGFAALARLDVAGLLDASIGTVRTPSGGLHLYFSGTSQRTAHLPASHVDFLSGGGYALAPPSQIDAAPYRYVTGFALRHGELDWQAAAGLLEPPREPAPHPPRPQPSGPGGTRVARLARWVAAQREGNRNEGLFWAANRALEDNQAADLSPLAAAARQAGLPEPEIARTLESARSTTLGRPQARPEPPGREAEGTS
jgi:Bifunctional DNA primase/polymerase, N-terminal